MDERSGMTIRLNTQAKEAFLQRKAEIEAKMGMQLTVSQVIILLVNATKEKQQ